MNSDATVYAPSSKESLVNFKSDDFGKVHLVDGETLKVASKGDAKIRISSGATCTFKDMRYIPGLKRILISVGRLDSEGYHVDFENNREKLSRKT